MIFDGQTGQVTLSRNSTTTINNSPADPADQPPLATALITQRGRTRNAGGGRTFLDLAVPWTDLSAVGVGPTTLLRLWAGSSTLGDRLDSDIACHDGAGGAANLSDNASVRVTLDPNATGGGADGGVGQTRAVEGGPRCSAAPGIPPDSGLFWIFCMLMSFSAIAVRLPNEEATDDRQSHAVGRSGAAGADVCLRRHQ